MALSQPSPVAPHSAAHSPSPAHPSKQPSPSSKVKPINVFSNDGSFLERLQRSKREEEERKQADVVAQKKRGFDDRFKKRGKRPAPSADTPDSGSSGETDEPAGPAKKAKTSEPLSQYEKEVQGYQSRLLKDQGIGVRPLVK
ncbi:uncharacterized protein EI90DRAFT_3067608 [Cantharellus anzutake]|uniref:uncharacterized protein n=1 Tax=Cantharellus anzutake TaxID=1750568 RepID=UPI001905DF9C|nr:uncharacterized protein EI90DRAFT_3067608 [Cantharellus anzutake]KAF8327401.1 hypothetical protein EI90DRAFT_3067608 [Cantharellus anzutake]